MALHLTPDPGDPGEPQVRLGRIGGSDAGELRQIVRDGVQVLAHGALICPSCELPMAIHRPLPIGGEVRCGFCDHAERAGSFVRTDTYDTVPNEVYVVARVV